MVTGGTFRKVLRVVERSALALGMAAALVVVGGRRLAMGGAGRGAVVRVRSHRRPGRRARVASQSRAGVARRAEAPGPDAAGHAADSSASAWSVVVLAGTDDWTLNRAVGHIEGTPKPGDDGNVGLAGHRDGFFRPLKDIAVGDVIEIATGERVDRYRVTQTLIVSAQRRVGARPHRDADADARDLLPVLLHWFGAEAVHRPGGARRRHRRLG